ncbi:hypothetical protein CPLU01_14269 [Colletotrichum plurivorum]|uniref:Integral membrane protein n=1 Tax=Colletotrichum plurivorum TaxID=2175906 RepID=A0A8H6N0E8_9PEZI|nr:hypothetical protein CPLU01_14269 [Colletotrichum plurivorum]
MNEAPDSYDSDNSPHSIRPLPPVLRHGLAAVATMGFFSFFTSLGLLAFLTYKLVSWHSGPPRQPAKDPLDKAESPAPTEAVFIIPNEWTEAAADAAAAARAAEEPEPARDSWWRRAVDEPPNQFLVLVFNLLLADIQQALAFLLNVEWLARNAIEVGTGTCWTQGWFVSTGDLASSVFITGIAVHTYMSIVSAKPPPTWVFHTAIVLMWGFVYGTGILGVIITENGKEDGGLYVRAGAWCWINSKYQDIRLALHYLWIFVSLVVTTIIYFVIFFHLQKIARRSGGVVPCCETSSPPITTTSSCSISTSMKASSCRSGSTSSCSNKPRRAKPPLRIHCLTSILRRIPGIPDYARQHTFLLYPLVYVVCTMPLAAGRLASMMGHEVSLGYLCFAGAMIACNGWLDVVLYSSTRRSIVFSGDGPPSPDTGLETFAFMCPQPPKFGNTTTVTGAGRPSRRRKWSEKMARRGLTVDRSSDGLRGLGGRAGADMAIRCETVTTVSVEVNNSRTQVTRPPKLAAIGRKMSDASSFGGTSTSRSSRSSGLKSVSSEIYELT